MLVSFVFANSSFTGQHFFPSAEQFWNLSSSVTVLPPTIHSVPMLSRRRLCLGTRNDEPFINIKSSARIVDRQQPAMSATIRMRGCIIAKWPRNNNNNNRIQTRSEKWISCMRKTSAKAQKWQKQHRNEIFITRKYFLDWCVDVVCSPRCCSLYVAGEEVIG